MSQVPEPARALLDLQGVAVTYRNRAGLHEVCSDVSLSVRSGETLAVIGESGSGKSVTVLAVTGLLGAGGAISRGQVNFQGEDITNLSDKERRKRGLRGRRIGMIFQNPSRALDPVFTIGQHLQEALEVRGRMSRSAIREQSIKWLRHVSLPDPQEQLNRYPHQLSGGQRQRAMIAVALASEPDLLIADEPTTALDVTIQAQILGLIRQLQNEMQLGLLLVTHDFGVVAAMADRVAVMYAGEVVEIGPLAEIITAPRHPYTKALIASLPTGVPGAHIEALGGSVPTAAAMPEGCRFHLRCPVAIETCRSNRPVLAPISAGHEVRCLLQQQGVAA